MAHTQFESAQDYYDEWALYDDPDNAPAFVEDDVFGRTDVEIRSARKAADVATCDCDVCRDTGWQTLGRDLAVSEKEVA